MNKTLLPTNKLRVVKNEIIAHIFILPLIVSILGFTLFPMGVSLYYSFFDYDIVSSPVNFGLHNYINPFTRDWAGFSGSLAVTFLYTLISLPLNFVLTFALSLFLNQKSVKGMRVFRVLFYLPCLIPAVVSGLLWSNITEPDYGVANMLLGKLGIPPFAWFSSADTALVSLFITSLFSLGGGTIIWIAQMNAIPESLLESAEVEGAGYFRKVFSIIIPCCTPMIFYTLITGVIGGLQTFSSVYVLMNDANSSALNFYVIGVYTLAFGKNAFGYACAQSWLLFIIIAILSACMFKLNKFVVYGEDF